jgi:Tfp pilus assembly protein PilX
MSRVPEVFVSRSLPTDRRGIALALALFATVIATLLITAVFYIARLEQRMGNNRIASVQAREAAETGLAAVLANWNTATYNTMANGGVVTIGQTPVGGGASYSGAVRRLTPTTFVIQMNGDYRIGGQVVTRRQLARIVRLTTPAIDMNAAVTTRTGITVTGSSQVSGVDSIPSNWGGLCPPPGATRPGIRDSSGAVSTSGACSGASCITGSPQILTDPTINSNTFDTFGDLNFADLASLAEKTISGTVNGIGPSINTGPPVSCRTGVLTNWGDPLNPAGACGNYFPIIYAPGDVRLTGGWGQGILLVAGDLEISGGVEFYGPVIVQGRIRSTGTGGHIYGGLMAANADFSVNLLSGNSVVNFSSCTINRALNGSARAKGLRERSWAQVY